MSTTKKNYEHTKSLVERKIHILKLRYEINEKEITTHYRIIDELRKEQRLIEEKLGVMKK